MACNLFEVVTGWHKVVTFFRVFSYTSWFSLILSRFHNAISACL